jgi:hypothetical protein
LPALFVADLLVLAFDFSRFFEVDFLAIILFYTCVTEREPYTVQLNGEHLA